MRKLNHRTLERRLRTQRQAVDTEIDWLLARDPDDPKHRTRVELFTIAANDQADDAIAARNYDGDGRGGSDGTHPERHALAGKTDHVHERMTKLLGLLALVEDSILAVRDLAGELRTSLEEHDRRAASAVAAAVGTAGAGHCSNCSRWCTGTRDDRLKAGRCAPGCYDYWQRTSTERPRGLWDAWDAGATTDAR